MISLSITDFCISFCCVVYQFEFFNQFIVNFGLCTGFVNNNENISALHTAKLI